MTLISVDWNYSPYTEAIRLMQAAHNIQNYFYAKRGFVVLPKLVKSDSSTVYFPTLPHETMSLIFQGSHDIKSSIPLENGPVVQSIMREVKVDQKQFEQFQATTTAPFLTVLNDTYLRSLCVEAKVATIEIRPTGYGTICTAFSSTYGKYDKHRCVIYVRFDAKMGNIVEALLSDMLHKKYLYSDVYSWFELEAITDHYITDVLKLSHDDFSPTLSHVRRNQQGTLRQQSNLYLEQLGYPNGPIFTSDGESITLINSKQLSHLSPDQKNVLLHLIKNRNTVVSFDTIAQIVWKEEWYERYSQEAIAKLIQRIRDKISQAGIHTGVIQSVKKQGYILTD